MKKPVRYFGYVHTLPQKTNKDKKRVKKHLKQLKKEGFDNTELWNLDSTFTQFILPRLKAYIEGEKPWHESRNEFFEKAQKALRAFEIHYEYSVKGTYWGEFLNTDGPLFKEYDEGMKCFVDVYLGLWN
jgi:hypothetical protein